MKHPQLKILLFEQKKIIKLQKAKTENLVLKLNKQQRLKYFDGLTQERNNEPFG